MLSAVKIILFRLKIIITCLKVSKLHKKFRKIYFLHFFSSLKVDHSFIFQKRKHFCYQISWKIKFFKTLNQIKVDFRVLLIKQDDRVSKEKIIFWSYFFAFEFILEHFSFFRRDLIKFKVFTPKRKNYMLISISFKFPMTSFSQVGFLDFEHYVRVLLVVSASFLVLLGHLLSF